MTQGNEKYSSDYIQNVAVNDEILFEGPFELYKEEDLVLKANGQVLLSWNKEPHVFLTGTTTPDSSYLSIRRSTSLKLPGSSQFIPVQINNIYSGSHQSISFKGYVNGCGYKGDNSSVTSVHGVLVNYPIRCHRYKPEYGSTVLNWNDWRIVITEKDNLEDIINRLENYDRYAITHEIQITRVGDSSFTFEEFKNMSTMLFYFFTLVSGRYVNAIKYTGYSEARAVWQEWGSWMIDGWIDSSTWIDSLDMKAVPLLFPGFCELWQKEHWSNTLRNVIHMYVASLKNVALLETSIVLAQNAIELIAWEYLAKDQQLIQQDKFRGIASKKKSKHLCDILQIPTAIPADMQGLRKVSELLNFTELSEAISEIRHSIVHPDNKSREVINSVSEDVYSEAWECALWLIEMCILKLSNYYGYYSDRRKFDKFVGNVSIVPWVHNAESSTKH